MVEWSDIGAFRVVGEVDCCGVDRELMECVEVFCSIIGGRICLRRG